MNPLYVELAAMIDHERASLNTLLKHYPDPSEGKAYHTGSVAAVIRIADALADTLVKHDPKFSREVFLRACGFGA